MRLSGALPVALVVLALGVAACGGGDDSEGLPRGEFVRKANAVCSKFDKRTDAIAQPRGAGGDREDLAELAAYLDKVLPVVQNAHDELSALEPQDDELARRWDDYLGDLRGSIGEIENARDNAKDGDEQATKTAIEKADDRSPDGEPIPGLSACT